MSPETGHIRSFKTFIGHFRSRWPVQRDFSFGGQGMYHTLSRPRCAPAHPRPHQKHPLYLSHRDAYKIRVVHENSSSTVLSFHCRIIFKRLSTVKAQCG